MSGRRCPVCGGMVGEVYHPYDITYGRPVSFVKCVNCGILTKVMNNER